MVQSLVIFFALLTAAVMFSYFRWKSRTDVRLLSGSAIAKTVRGPIEYASIGQGPPVLIVHGAMGGYDQGLLIARSIRASGLHFIAPSRPGYLRTPLEVGRTPQEQADALTALLDSLNIGKALVVGVSAGGPSALHFAIRHSARCSGLVLVSAVVQRFKMPKGSRSTAIGPVLAALIHSDFAGWIVAGLARVAPGWATHYLISARESARLDLRTKQEFLIRLLDTVALLSRRWSGFVNDGVQIGSVCPCYFGEINCPTLIIHGRADRLVAMDGAEDASRRISGAELMSIEGGSHFAFFLQDEVSSRIKTFVARHIP